MNATENSTTPPSAMIAAYGLAVLFLANLLNFADRALLGIVVEPIRKELGLSDTEISLVTGVSFSVVYLVAGIAIARWVDRGKRRLILVLGVILWSAATAATGMAQDFVSLAATRMLIGIGEAVVFPVALSLLADLYPGPKLPRAVSIFQSSAGVGIMLGSILAGILAAALGWRTMFMIFGVAGVVVGLLVLTMRSTPRTRLSQQELLEPSNLMPAMRSIMAIPGLGWLAFGYGSSHMLMHCLPAWGPAFLQRSHNVALADVGVLIGPPAVIGGVFGTILSGILATRLIQRSGDRTAGLIVPIIAMPLAMPAYALYLFAPTLPVVLVSVAAMNSCCRAPSASAWRWRWRWSGPIAAR